MAKDRCQKTPGECAIPASADAHKDCHEWWLLPASAGPTHAHREPIENCTEWGQGNFASWLLS